MKIAHSRIFARLYPPEPMLLRQFIKDALHPRQCICQRSVRIKNGQAIFHKFVGSSSRGNEAQILLEAHPNEPRYLGHQIAYRGNSSRVVKLSATSSPDRIGKWTAA